MAGLEAPSEMLLVLFRLCEVDDDLNRGESLHN